MTTILVVKAGNKQKVFVALSGGVDSSVSAALLLKAGYDVCGIFMREWTPKGMQCNEGDNRQMATRAAAHLAIPFAVWDFRKEYEKKVANYMLREYKAGRTPNPDVMCNSHIKFGIFLDAALKAGADYIATGHYVKKRKAKSEKRKTLEHVYTAKDANKDQSYFLWTLTQEQLQHCLFPLGEYMKPSVRMIAKKIGLPNWDRKDSQGVCFVGELDFGAFLRSCLPVHTGDIVTTTGEKIGTHDGTAFYTIGQSCALQMQNFGKLFVANKNITTNTLIVTEENNPALFKKEIKLSNLNWISGIQPKLPLKCFIRIRYRQPLQEATMMKSSVQCKNPQRAVSPGQSAVFYTKNGEMLGGGIIEA